MFTHSLRQVLISINPAGCDTLSRNEAESSFISETFLGTQTSMEAAEFIGTVVGATYVPSNSLLESFAPRGHIEYTVQLTTEDSVYTNPSCRHEDFCKMYQNLIDECATHPCFAYNSTCGVWSLLYTHPCSTTAREVSLALLF
jgi:hypothetical protein